MAVRVYGIRHHGPGSARSLLSALQAYAPDALVIEGPAEAEPLLPYVVQEGMRPPVALVVYPPDAPRRAIYYPMANFSPEWQAFRYALQHDIPVRMMDLPMRHSLALADADNPPAEADEAAPAVEPETPPPAPEPATDQETQPTWRSDPLALLAQAAGYTDSELWWEEQVERRRDPADLFDAILEAMKTVRQEVPETREHDLLREAWMRRTIRAVRKEGAERIAVVCGAWHAPVLTEDALDTRNSGLSAKDDEARVRNLPKLKVAATWIPWTYHRLAYRSGYGAGVHSPGWYDLLWQSPAEPTIRWLASAAQLLREADLDTSSASVIEAVRLADALAAMRGISSPGMAELSESILTVLCHGEPAPLLLIRNKLEIGDVIGEVPHETPSVPLAEDLAALQRSLRLKPSTEIRTLDLDLRETNDLARSHLLHRLRILGINWGEMQRVSGSVRSTFHEIWQLQWQPEFAVAVIEANVWGNTVEYASAAAAVDRGFKSTDLAQLTELLDQAILAALGEAVDRLIDRVQEQAAVAADVRHLMDALLPLARAARYGDVRQTRAEHLVPVIYGLFERTVVGLPAACSSLDDDAAEAMLRSMATAQESLNILDDAEMQSQWQGVLQQLMTSDINGLVRGWCCRVLLERGVLSTEELHVAARLALSPATKTEVAAAWVQGLLRGSGSILLHQDGLWHALDGWLKDLREETFIELLPLLRRAFADFQPAERRAMGEKVKHLGTAPEARPAAARTAKIDHDRAARVLPVLAHVLGVPYDAH